MRLAKAGGSPAAALVALAVSCAPPQPLPVRAQTASPLPVRDAVVTPSPDSRFARLTHDQWRRAAADLLFLDDAELLDVHLREDSAAGGGLFERPGQLRVDAALWSDYAAAAEHVAALATSTPTRVERLAPSTDSDGMALGAEDRRDRFLAEHGVRAHRRLLTPRQRVAYSALFDQAPDLYDDETADGDPVRDGVRAVVEAWLQSPFFIYRVELGVGRGEGELTPYEIASRLSFALWGTMPDDELMASAADGALWFDGEEPSPVLADQVARMLEDERTTDAVAAFHRQLFSADGYHDLVMPDFLGVSDTWGAHVAREHELLVTSVFERDEGLRELLTTRRTVVNSELAAVYGVELDERLVDGWGEVELPAGERSGVLTSLGFLSSHAVGGAPDAIGRGVFISRHLACNDVAPPPDDIPSLASVDPGRTSRETIEAMTEQPGTSCAGCHASTINPFGFALEGFDAVGAVRDVDQGIPIDTSSVLWVGTDAIEVDDAIQMGQRLAEHPAVHRCYAEHWVRFLLGRAPDPGHDERALGDAAAASLREGGSVRQLMFELLTSEAFLTRVDDDERAR